MTYKETMELIQNLKKENSDLKSENKLLGDLLALKEMEFEGIYQCYLLSGGTRKIDIDNRSLVKWAVKHLKKKFKLQE